MGTIIAINCLVPKTNSIVGSPAYRGRTRAYLPNQTVWGILQGAENIAPSIYLGFKVSQVSITFDIYLHAHNIQSLFLGY